MRWPRLKRHTMTLVGDASAFVEAMASAAAQMRAFEHQFEWHYGNYVWAVAGDDTGEAGRFEAWFTQHSR